jgi:hypothetical protein
MLGAGAVYVYRRSGDVWSFDAYIKAPQPQAGAGFGISLALHDRRLLVGAATESVEQATTNPHYDDSGAAYLYDSISPRFQPRVFRPDPSDRLALYGLSVALGSRWLAIGGPDADEQRGAVRVFEVDP